MLGHGLNLAGESRCVAIPLARISVLGVDSLHMLVVRLRLVVHNFLVHELRVLPLETRLLVRNRHSRGVLARLHTVSRHAVTLHSISGLEALCTWLLRLELHPLVAHYLGLDRYLLLEPLAGEAHVSHAVNWRSRIRLKRGLMLVLMGLLLLSNEEGVILGVHGTTAHCLDLHGLLHQDLDGGLGCLVDLVGHGFHLVGVVSEIALKCTVRLFNAVGLRLGKKLLQINAFFKASGLLDLDTRVISHGRRCRLRLDAAVPLGDA